MGKRYNFTKVEKLVSKGKTFSQQPIICFMKLKQFREPEQRKFKGYSKKSAR